MKRAGAASGGGNSAGGGSGGSAAELELAAPLDAAAAKPADGSLAEAGSRRTRFRSAALVDALSTRSVKCSRFRPKTISTSRSSGGPGGIGM